jgi:hypothetical protein
MDVLDAVRDHLDAHFADPAPAAASVTFLGLEPIEVLLFRDADAETTHYVTLGCSRHPMGDPTAVQVDPVRGPRAELVLSVRAGGVLPGLHRRLAVLAAAPAVDGVILRPDGLLDLGEPLWDTAPFTAALLGDDAIAELALDAPADPVRFLALTPITATEAAWVRLRGADALREAWREAGIDVRDPARAAAAPS